jgi:hypothetical protein
MIVSTLKPSIMPFCCRVGTSPHDTLTLVDDIEAACTFCGPSLGTEIFNDYISTVVP